MRKLRIRLILILCGCSLLSFDGGGNYFEISKNIDMFTTMYKELNSYYVDDIEPNAFMQRGMDAMLEGLDPYTVFISEADIEDYRFQTTGRYGGIGCYVRQYDEHIVVSEVIQGYGADKAGIKGGDRILFVDGVDVKSFATDEVGDLMRGEPNSQVTMRIERLQPNGAYTELEVRPTRQEIQVLNVPFYGMINEQVGYIKLSNFMEDAAAEVENAFIELRDGNTQMQSVILDLRGNPGGLLREAVKICNLFIEKNELVVETKGRLSEWDAEFKTRDNPVDLEMKVVVLINHSSASASEIVSGTLQDLDRGVVIGERSYGKGLVQTTRPLSYNAQLKLTTAKYYIPSGRCIQALNYAERRDDGSVGRIPDSLIQEFTTRNGRVVYDGGGILPDLEVEMPALSDIAYTLLSEQLIFDYATIFQSNNDSLPVIPSEYYVSDELFAAFAKWIRAQSFEYTTQSEDALDSLRVKSKEDGYYEAIKETLDALDIELSRDKGADIEKHEDELRQLLNEEIVRRYFYEQGSIESSFQYDQQIQQACSVLANEASYNAYLQP
ncbi:MAG: S41 family peptidase [Chitinophagales bacterium]